jgi:uncharacterized protein DUF4372
MIFGQVTNRDSLRDLILAINAHSGKSYHLGFGKSVTLNNLAKANLNRNVKSSKSLLTILLLLPEREGQMMIFK